MSPRPAAGTLDDRSREVLKALIQSHVATGEPVGSETLSRTLNRVFSPATLRNVMADLERMGYLDHPHTSAGRIPTDDGYRVYVDSLMGYDPLPPRDTAAIEQGLRAGSETPEGVIENASRLLSRLSHNVGFVLAPEIGRTSFMHIDFVGLTHPRVLVVMVSRSGLVTNKVIELEEPLGQDQLQTCANYLNAHFAGLPLQTIRARLLQMMGEEKALYDSLLQEVIAVGERAFAGEDEARASVYLDGTANILEKPELADLDRMRELFRTFEAKSRLVKILNACITGDGVRVIIGHENPDPAMRDMSLVTVGMGTDSGWGLGVLGSTRMEYGRAVALVEQVAQVLSRALQELKP